MWSQTWRWPRCSPCSRDSTIPSISCVKACGKCWSLGYSCPGPEGAKSSPWERQGSSHPPSQEQGRQGSPALLGQDWRLNWVLGCKQGGGSPRGTGKDRVCPQGPGSGHWQPSVCTFKGKCVCKHPACSFKPDLRSMTEHLEVMIWWVNYLVLLFSPIFLPPWEAPTLTVIVI